MEPLTPQVMHKLVFTILVHGLPDNQTGLALDVLVEALNNPNNQVRELAVVALAELQVSSAKRVAALTRGLQDPASRVRRRAARALGDFGANAIPSIPVLIAGLRDHDTSVRRDCAGALGRLGPAAYAATEALVGMLAEPDVRIRVVSATALKRIGRVSVPAVADGMMFGDAETRGRCVTLLAHLAPDDADAVDAIRTATEDPDPEVCRRAWVALDAMNVPFSMAAAV
jgi:hypothetical protein